LKKRLNDLHLENLWASAVSWFRERIDLQPIVGFLAKKTVPIHRFSWLYLFGGAALFLFALQAGTGCLLMLYYQPSESTANESVRQLMTQVPYGWLIRSIHSWGASLLIGMIGIHFVTVLFSKAYRKPREMTWLAGMCMLFLALAFGFSGYLLPWNERAYYATLVGTKVPDAVPVLGHFVVHFLRGGEEVTGATLTRFFALHVAFLPLAFGAMLLAHLAFIQFQGTSVPLGMPPEKIRDRRPFYSEFVLIDCCIWLLLLGVIVTLAIFQPAEIGEKADLLKPAPEGIAPEWFFLFLFKTLKMVPETVGVAMFVLVALFFLAVPFLDRNAMRERKSPGFTAVFAIVLLYMLTVEILAWVAPGVQHAPEVLMAETYSVSRFAVTLTFVWIAIGFLLFYLRQLLLENTRVRQLRAEANAHDKH
jgi:cytochrome b6